MHRVQRKIRKDLAGHETSGKPDYTTTHGQVPATLRVRKFYELCPEAQSICMPLRLYKEQLIRAFIPAKKSLASEAFEETAGK